MLITGGALPLPVSWLPGPWSLRAGVAIIIRGLTIHKSGQGPIIGGSEAPGVANIPQVVHTGPGNHQGLGRVNILFSFSGTLNLPAALARLLPILITSNVSRESSGEKVKRLVAHKNCLKAGFIFPRQGNSHI